MNTTIEQHLFVTPDLPKDLLDLEIPKIEALHIRSFLPERNYRTEDNRSIQGILLTSPDYLAGNAQAIQKWLHHDPKLLLRIVVIGDAEKPNLPASIQDSIAFVCSSAASKSALVGNLAFVFEQMELQFENLCLNSRLALSSEDLRKIAEVGQALSTEKEYSRLIDLIMERALDLVNADSGSIYITELPEGGGEITHLRFVRSSMQLDADQFLLPIDRNSIAGYVALTNKPLLIKDVHELPEDASYSFNAEFDKTHNYYTKSMMVIPMTNYREDVIGVLQLINRKQNKNANLTAKEMEGPAVIEFSNKDYGLASALAGQAAVAIDNQRLIEGQRRLLESFIRLIANAIDAKSAYTGGHCERVPILTEMLAEAACKAKDGPFADFDLNQDEWYELRIAAGLHDCGKIVTPVHVMDKATKLQTIFDRIKLIEVRIELLKRDAAIHYQKALREDPSKEDALKSAFVQEIEELNEIDAFLKKMNIGGEYLEDSDIERLHQIAKKTLTIQGQTRPLISEEELYNLSVRKGTLTKEERLIINGHMVETVKMLEALPFPPNLQRVPEYAGGHHEKMDGKGYPKGIYAGDMSIPARIMAIADVFEALTALDRPYKKGKPLSETMKIMGNMKRDNHLDPELFDLFVKSKTYLHYAKEYLPEKLIDEVDEASLLAIEPKPFDTPDYEIRKKRWQDFLPEYKVLA